SGRALDEALAGLRDEIAASDARIERGELPALRANPLGLAQVFQALLRNAIAFRSAAPPRVSVSAQRVAGGWAFAVSDNGIGIAPRHPQCIFEVFERLRPRGEGSGAGIGLAICRKIVAHHGGRIWVESEPGRGSTFHFEIAEAVPAGGAAEVSS